MRILKSIWWLCLFPCLAIMIYGAWAAFHILPRAESFKFQMQMSGGWASLPGTYISVYGWEENSDNEDCRAFLLAERVYVIRHVTDYESLKENLTLLVTPEQAQVFGRFERGGVLD